MPLSGIDQIALQLRVMRPRRLVHVHLWCGWPRNHRLTCMLKSSAIKRYCDVAPLESEY